MSIKNKNILVELYLTVPARLAWLLPHLPLMMSLMVHALRCRGELDGLALRTLEFWVDNLNPDYLYRIMSHDPKACFFLEGGGGGRAGAPHPGVLGGQPQSGLPIQDHEPRPEGMFFFRGGGGGMRGLTCYLVLFSFCLYLTS